MIRSCVLGLLFCLSVITPIQVQAISLENEIKLGAKEHRKVVARFGIYKDKALQDYVKQVGERVAKHSSRPELEYHFTILNDEMINAFALPGGFVYLTRGMLTHMNSESELAAVLGHELAHISEKHGMRSVNKKKLVDFVSQVAAAVSGNAGLYELGNVFGGVLLKGYSREFELEADKVGSGYMAKAGYSPEAMLRTIEILKAKDRIEIEHARIEKRPPKVYHGFLSTHPDHDTRYREAVRSSMKLLEDYKEFLPTDAFLEKLNGLPYGDVRQRGVLRKTTFYLPKGGIKMNFPKGWKVESQERDIRAVSATSDAVIAVRIGRLRKGLSAREHLEKGFGMNIREGRDVTISNLPGFLGIADRADSLFGPRPTRVVLLMDKYKRLVYVLSGAGKHDLRNISNDRAFIATIFSFDMMDREDRRVARAPRLQVVRAEEGTTMEALAKQSPIANYALDKLRVMNGLYPDGQPIPGQLIKVVD